MDYLTQVEYNSLKNEINNKDIAVKSQQYIFEQRLKNGLGEEIHDYFKNPPKPDKKLEMKIKLQKKWEDFRQKINRLLFEKSER